MGRREVQSDALLGAMAISNECFLYLFDPSKDVSPAGVQCSPQLVEQLVHGRI